jgi:hypothetical protein
VAVTGSQPARQHVRPHQVLIIQEAVVAGVEVVSVAAAGAAVVSVAAAGAAAVEDRLE